MDEMRAEVIRLMGIMFPGSLIEVRLETHVLPTRRNAEGQALRYAIASIGGRDHYSAPGESLGAAMEKLLGWVKIEYQAGIWGAALAKIEETIRSKNWRLKDLVGFAEDHYWTEIVDEEEAACVDDRLLATAFVQAQGGSVI